MMKMEDSSKRRPFFSSPEDLYDEEYYDEQSPEKKRRLTPEQVSIPVFLIYTNVYTVFPLFFSLFHIDKYLLAIKPVEI